MHRVVSLQSVQIDIERMKNNSALSETVNSWIDSYNFPAEPANLYEPIRYTLEAGGKRLRPTLLLAAAKAFGAADEDVKNQCIGIEMFHNFTLLHDDLMDNSELRRGRPTVHRRWDANTAILSGDTMLTLATELIAKCDPRFIEPVLSLFNRTAIQVYEGQQYDMDFENRNDVTVPEYMEMIRLKTSVLLACALKMGALLGQASPSDAEALYDFGIKLGLAFQLRDDYLDTFGDPLVFGKSIGGDIINDKKTWLMITARNEDTTGVMKKALEGRFPHDEKINAVTNVYRQLNLDNRITELIARYGREAVDTISPLKMDNEIRRYLISLAENLSNRAN